MCFYTLYEFILLWNKQYMLSQGHVMDLSHLIKMESSYIKSSYSLVLVSKKDSIKYLDFLLGKFGKDGPKQDNMSTCNQLWSTIFLLIIIYH